jgi:hypothetical protein
MRALATPLTTRRLLCALLPIAVVAAFAAGMFAPVHGLNLSSTMRCAVG